MQNEETPNSNLDKLSEIKSLISKLSSPEIKTKQVSVDNIIEKINEFSKSIEEESSNTNENNLMRKKINNRIGIVYKVLISVRIRFWKTFYNFSIKRLTDCF